MNNFFEQNYIYIVYEKYIIHPLIEQSNANELPKQTSSFDVFSNINNNEQKIIRAYDSLAGAELFIMGKPMYGIMTIPFTKSTHTHTNPNSYPNIYPNPYHQNPFNSNHDPFNIKSKFEPDQTHDKFRYDDV
jgi:hypothetical protein